MRQFGILLLGLDFQKAELFLDLDHVHLVSPQEVFLVLIENADKVGIVVLQDIADATQVADDLLVPLANEIEAGVLGVVFTDFGIPQFFVHLLKDC